VGIGTATPGQRLSVAGTVESASGGFKFPDGTVQTTAAVGGSGGGGTITGVNAGAGLTGGGSSGSVTLDIGAGTGLSVGADNISGGTNSAALLVSGSLGVSGSGTITATNLVGNGANLTALNASNLFSGTVPTNRMPGLAGDVTSSAGTVATTLTNTGVTAGN